MVDEYKSFLVLTPLKRSKIFVHITSWTDLTIISSCRLEQCAGPYYKFSMHICAFFGYIIEHLYENNHNFLCIFVPFPVTLLSMKIDMIISLVVVVLFLPSSYS